MIESLKNNSGTKRLLSLLLTVAISASFLPGTLTAQELAKPKLSLDIENTLPKETAPEDTKPQNTKLSLKDTQNTVPSNLASANNLPENSLSHAGASNPTLNNEEKNSKTVENPKETVKTPTQTNQSKETVKTPALTHTNKSATSSQTKVQLTGLEHMVPAEKISLKEMAELTSISKETVIPNSLATLKSAFFSTGEADRVSNTLPIELDGSKIETHYVEWVTEDNQAEADNDKDLLSLLWQNDLPKDVKLRINYAMSGQFDYQPGTVTFKIPKYIFKDREDKVAGEVALSVPEVGSIGGVFVYSEDDDNYIISNNQLIDAAGTGYIEIMFKNLTPHTIIDQVKHAKTDPYTSTMEIRTNKGNVISHKSNELVARIDTSAKVTSAQKEAIELFEEWQKDFPDELKPDKPDDYVYATWKINATTVSSQTFKVNLKDEPTSDGKTQSVIVIGYKNLSNFTIIKGDNQATLDKELFAGYIEDGRNFWTMIYTAYPKSDFEVGKTYTFKNKGTYTLTSTDDNEVTTQESTAELKYTPVSFKRPTGHFYVDKYGYGDEFVYRGGKSEGRYTAALNYLKEDKEVDISYHLFNKAFGMPWTLETGKDFEDISNYGKTPYSVHVVDDFLKIENGYDFLDEKDYCFKNIRFIKPEVYDYVKYTEEGIGYKEVIENGVFEKVIRADIPKGSWGYKETDDVNSYPIFTVSGKKQDGEYVEYAKVSFQNGAIHIEAKNNATVEDEFLTFPSDVIAYKVDTTTTKAAVLWHMYPTVTIKPTQRIKEKIAELFQHASKPNLRIANKAAMDVDVTENGTQVNKKVNDDTGYDLLTGFVYGADLEKSAEVTNITDKQTVKINYQAVASIQTNASQEEQLQEFKNKGIFKEQESAIWYDLLPKGVSVDISSIRLRNADSILATRTILDYKGSGRTLLIVEAKLTPDYKYRTQQQSIMRQQGLVDSPSISFDAYYSWNNTKDLGLELTNNIVYESGNKKLGTAPGFMGEPDDPTVGNNQRSKDATVGVTELLKNLNPTHDNPSFLYAKAITNINEATAAFNGIKKEVDVNQEGDFGDGLKEQAAKNVYEGGEYTYKIRVKSSGKSASKAIKIYDKLEGYIPPSNKADYQDQQFRGIYQSIDLRDLKAKGIEAKVYYSTQENLVLDDTNDRKHLDLSDTSIWSSIVPTDTKAITAIAIDASKQTDGTDYVLPQDIALNVYINMRAPMVKDIEADTTKHKDYYDQYRENNESEVGLAGGVHAYNNISFTSIAISDNGNEGPNLLARHDYTKVGLKPYIIKVIKSFADEDDLENKRPKEVTIQLVENGVENEQRKLTLSANNNWQASFTDLPYSDSTGKAIQYTVKELPVPGYSPVLSAPRQEGNVIVYHIKNVRGTEKVNFKGQKLWKGEGPRANSVMVTLLADGKKLEQRAIYPNSQGKWTYSFKDLPKYKKNANGTLSEIKYTIQEDTKLPGYVTKVTGNDIVNTYEPYGDLVLKKSVEGITEPNKYKQYSFKLFIKDRAGKDDKARYEYVDASGQVLGSIANGETISFTAEQVITIKKIPYDYSYELKEEVPKGFKLVSEAANSNLNSSNLQGKIQAGSTVTALAHNIYKAEGKIAIKGNKKLKGAKLKAHQFIFDVYQKLDDGTEKLYRSVSNEADGNILFGYFHFTAKHHDKTYTFIVKERIPNEKQGYTYDTNVSTFSIKVIDNGDGTLTLTPSFKEGSISFINTYDAKGKLSLRAKKLILGGTPVKKEQFTFKLVDKDTQKEIAQAKNDENGDIVFPAIEYTLKDVGKTFNYTASEVKGNDESYTYDTSTIDYTVKVVDLGDGTLGTTSTVKDNDNYIGTHWHNAEEAIFVNKIKPGSLSLEKALQLKANEEFNDYQNQQFQFDIVLNVPEGMEMPNKLQLKRKFREPKTGKIIDLSNIKNESRAASVASLDSSSSQPNEPYQATMTDKDVATNQPKLRQDSMFKQTQESSQSHEAVLAKSNISFRSTSSNSTMQATPARQERQATYGPGSSVLSSNTIGTVKWTLYDNGHLYLEPTSGNTGKFSDYTEEDLRWHTIFGSNEDKIISFSIKANSTIKIVGKQLSGMFASLPNIKHVDLTGFDTSEATSFERVFSNCHKLETIVGVNTLDASKVTWMLGMFEFCKKLTSLNLNLNTNSVTNMGQLFQNCTGLTNLTLQLNTANVNYMNFMFEGCENLTSLNLSSFNTENVTTMYAMFNNCKKLTNLNLLSFNTINVTNMQWLFKNCESLETLDLSSFNTENVKFMDAMFYECKKLATLNLSKFNTSNVIGMEEMFYSCEALTKLNLANFDTTNVKKSNSSIPSTNGMQSMFSYCSNLEELDLSDKFAITSQTNPIGMFNACFKLKKVTLGSKVATLKGTNFPDLLSQLSEDKEVIYTGKWVKADNSQQNALTSAEMMSNYTTAYQGTWIAESKKNEYTINFDPNGASGTKQDLITKLLDYYNGTIYQYNQLPTPNCPFTRYGYNFVGWSYDKNWQYGTPGSGFAIYRLGDKNIIKKDKDNYPKAGEKITLYAIWEKEETEVTVWGDRFTVSLKPNEIVTLEGLPAGASYTIKENLSNISNWHVCAEENVAGIIEANKTPAAKITNAPGVATEVKVQFRGTKYVDGGERANFEFELYDTTDENSQKLIGTASSSYAGTFSFEPLTFKETGTHYYKISEKIDPNNKNIAYDKTTYQLKVDVSKSYYDGSLHAKTEYQRCDWQGCSYDNDYAGEFNTIRFSNSIKKGSLEIVKNVENAGQSEYTQFTAQVDLGDEGVRTVSIYHNNTYTIYNLPIGTKYSVKEINIPSGYEFVGIENATGVINSAEPIKVTVKNKSIKKPSGKFTVKATKELLTADGSKKALEAGKYQFTLSLKDNNNNSEKIVATTTNDKDGNIIFKDVTVPSANVSGWGDYYTYIIRETPGKDKGITYDNSTHEISLLVYRADGKIVTEVSYANANPNVYGDHGTPPVFTNRELPPPNIVTGEVQLKKTVIKGTEAIKSKNYQFKVELYNEDDSVLSGSYAYISDKDNQHKGKVQHGDSISINAAETITIKKLPKGTKVKVTEQVPKGFKLNLASSKTEGIVDDQTTLELALTNEYMPKGKWTPKVTKKLINKNLANYRFTFNLIQAGKIIASATNDDKGNINFPSINYTMDDLKKEHNYLLAEEQGDDPNIIYDKKEYTINVKLTEKDGELVPNVTYKDKQVKDAITFVNRYRHSLPTTGKEHLIIASVIGTSLLLLALYLIKKKDKGGS